jgi:excisionase family DNA binding protein
MLGCSHKRLYQLLADKKLDSYKDGGSRKITVESIRAYIAESLDAARKEKLKRPR